jgi:predicted amidohydrolase
VTAPPDGSSVLRCAAVQLHAVLGDVDANLAACETAVRQAAADGARVVALPEFFTSGVAYRLDVAEAAQSVDGPAVQAMLSWANSHDVAIAGSMLVRDPDGHVRNAHLLAGPDGLLGRHDKDLPTMWENALYAPGHDDGLLRASLLGSSATRQPVDVGMALCWELTRSRTVRRLAGQVDLVLSGSGWWSVPQWRPRGLFAAWERANGDRALQAPADFARLVGAPVVHAAHVGDFDCPLPGLPGRYRGRYEGGTGMWASDGSGLAALPAVSAGPGTATGLIADVPVGRRMPPPAPSRYWLTPPGPVPTFAWHWQRAVGRPFYRRHVYRAPSEGS